jgi:hypothetical protein
MWSSQQFVLGLLVVAFSPQLAAAVEKPSDLIIGKWKDRAEPDDAIIEFAKGGTGSITDTTPKQTTQASISWMVKGTYGNACVILIKYIQQKGAEPLPKVAKPMTWLVAFDGKDTFITQPRENTVVFMERQK